ncbi:MAG: quinoprotein relay system zinc metallohydrolase 2 [Pseudomonadota bacterium]
MFDILITVCALAGAPCAERLLPSGLPEVVCSAEAKARASDWAKAHDLNVQTSDCVQQMDLSDRIDALEVQQIAAGVFVHQGAYGVPDSENGGDLANLGFIVGDEAVAVIDAGTTRAVAEQLYVAIRAQTDLPIHYLILSHMHPDHSLGAELFHEAGAEVLGHPNLGQALANRAESYERALARLIGPEGFLGTRLIGPDRQVEQTKLDLGGRSLLVEAHPFAHTETDVTVLDQKTGIWFMGDLVFAEHTPALDGTILGWQQLIAKLSKRDVKGIVPGHGPVPLPWPEGAAPMRAYLAAITEETRRAIADGLPMSTAVRKIGESQREHWKLFDEFNTRNATTAYQELEWE